MNFTTLFRLKENLNLDRKTLVILRWIALIGQFAAINFVYFFLKLEFPIYETYLIIFIGIITNIYLHFVIKTTLLKDFYSGLFLLYDLIQLGLLLYLTGGIHNPFSFFFRPDNKLYIFHFLSCPDNYNLISFFHLYTISPKFHFFTNNNNLKL